MPAHSTAVPAPGTFWRLTSHSNFPSLRHAEDAEWDGFSYFELREGRPFHGSFPRGMRIRVESGPGPLADQLANPAGLTIWSDRLTNELRPLIEPHVQLLPAPLHTLDADEPVPGYWLVNLLTTLDCLDRDRSVPWYDEEGTIGDYDDPCIIASRTEGVPIFKYLVVPGRACLGVICSHRVPLQLAKKGFTGVAFVRCRSCP